MSSEFAPLLDAARRRYEAAAALLAASLARLAVNSESYRDLLANAAKWGLIDDVEQWFRMRDLRNRIVHDYLPEKLAEIYSLIVGEYAPELLGLRDRLSVK